MKGLLNVACGIAIFVGGAGFLFGQLFFGTFSFAASLAGTSGVLAGVLGWRTSARPIVKHFTAVCCGAGIVGVALDVFHYYTELNSPGNYYAWFLVGPFVASLLLIGYFSLVPARPASGSRREASLV